jgi:predicted nucleic acid-binding protein
MRSRWSDALSPLRRVSFDTNAIIYGLEGKEPYLPLMREAFTAMERGGLSAVISTVVELECLVGPMVRQSRETIDLTQLFFLTMPGLTIRSVDRTIAQHAARIRAATRLTTIDAIIAATAIAERCDVIIGNDARMAARLSPIPYLRLDEFLL